ncbi:MAG: hypothetical protein ACC661_06105 [Verrucomicrobiales bacterium]
MPKPAPRQQVVLYCKLFAAFGRCARAENTGKVVVLTSRKPGNMPKLPFK